MNDPRATYDPSANPSPEPEGAVPPRDPHYSNIYNPQTREQEPQQSYSYHSAGGYGQPGSYYGAPYQQPAPSYGRQQQYPPQSNDFRYGDYAQYSPYPYPAAPEPEWRQPREKAPAKREEQPAYEWKLSDYAPYDEPSGEKRLKKKKGHGIVVFSVCLLLTLSAGLVCTAMFSLFGIGTDGIIAVSTPSEVISQPAETSSEAESAAVHLNLSSKPSVGAPALPEGELTIPQVAEKVTPSVVSVIIYVNSQFLEPAGIGSGIIFSEDGYIVTNAHVVVNGTDFKVHLHNGDPFDAEVIGIDTATDLAVLKIGTTGLTPAEFGSSSELVVGETVIAIGNPVNLNFAGSVTQGIVSALNRKVDFDSRYSINYIQTDAAINPGNSGGALANVYGQVIGINVAKIAATGYEGMGFAIPMSEAQPVIEDLLQYGRVTGRVKLGIEGRAIDEYDAKRYDWKAGVMIQSIDPNSDLIGKDVQKGDIITHINGDRIYRVEDVHAQLEGKAVGDTIELTIYRKISATRTTEFNVVVTLVEDAG